MLIIQNRQILLLKLYYSYVSLSSVKGILHYNWRLQCALLFFFLASFFFHVFSNSHAAADGLTHHSRASCINNEGISWDGKGYVFPEYKHNVGVISQQFPQRVMLAIFR